MDELLYNTLKSVGRIQKLINFVILAEFDTKSLKIDVNKSSDANINANKFGDNLPIQNV